MKNARALPKGYPQMKILILDTNILLPKKKKFKT